MDGKEEDGQRGAGRGHPCLLGSPDRQADEAERHEVEQDRGDGVQEETREVVAGGVHAPEQIIEAERDPRERDVLAHVHGREHPLDLRQAETPVMRVRQEVLRVVEVAGEPVLEGGEEGDDRQEGHDGGAPSTHAALHYTRSMILASERGIALLEVLIAGVILSVVTLGLALMFSLGQSSVDAEGGERIALYLAQKRMEELRTMGLASAASEPERGVPGFPPECPDIVPCQFLRRTTI